jgi:cytochrome d ubiquinol oxidase subunit II
MEAATAAARRRAGSRWPLLAMLPILLLAAAVGAVVAVIWGWFVAQHPDLLPQRLSIEQAAGADASLTTIIVVFAIAAVLVIPSLILLYVLAQRDALE